MGSLAWFRSILGAIAFLMLGFLAGYGVLRVPPTDEGWDRARDRSLDAQAVALGFSPAVLDLGRHPWHASVPFSTRFVNARPEAVRIALLEATCGCTDLNEAVFAGRVVASGESICLVTPQKTGNEVGSRTYL